MDTYVYRIRYKGRKEYWTNRDGKTIWLSRNGAEVALEDYDYLKNYKEWRSSLEIVKFSLTEVRDECI